MESLLLGHVTKPKLNNYVVVSASPKSRILNQSVQNFLNNASEVICLRVNPFLPLWDGVLA